MKRAIATLIPVILFVGGCLPKDPPLPPVISDIAESVVKVEAQNPRDWAQEWPTEGAINREAQRGCAKYNRVADRISWKCKVIRENSVDDCIVKEYLFACKPK